MIKPPRTAVNLVDFLLHIATTRGVEKSDTARLRGPIHAVTKINDKH